MQRYKREKVDPFSLPTSPGLLAGFYFSCGPVAGLGFWIGDLQGFVLAIVVDVIFWFLIALLKNT
jgi:hypothetical protein